MKRRSLAVLGILAMLLSLLFNPGTGHAQTSASGTVVAWGSNSYGQTDVPAGLNGVTAISAGAWHNLALKNDGTVVAWGCGSYDYGQCAVPAGLSGITAVDAGQWHSLALKSDGTVVAWGRNDLGQLNIPSGLSGVTAITAGNDYSLALKSDGTVVAWGYDNLGRASVPAGLSGVTAVAAGTSHSLALKSDGTVIGWGWNALGQTAVPAGLSDVTAIAAGWDYSLALKSDGTVVAWGWNLFGQTGVPAGLSGVTAIAAGHWHSLALKSDGTVVAWGRNDDYYQTNVPAGLNSVTAIGAGEMHSLALVQMDAAPAAQDQSVSTDEDTSLAITLTATDAENAALTYSIVTQPAHGVLSGTVPNVTYTPDANWNGTDNFTFKANDGLQDSNTATVTITVNPVNDAPVAVDQSVATPKNTPLAITLTATDVENSALTYTIVTGPTHGALTGTAPNLTYTPNEDYAGDDFIYFSANDGEQTSNVAMVNISVTIVSHHPSALDDSYSTNQNTALTIVAPGVLSNDTDEDGDLLSVNLVSGPAHGTLTLNSDGSFDYTPATNYAGQDSFTYRANDGELASNVATVSITVSQASQTPAAVDDSYSVIANTTLTISAPGVLGNDTDADGDTLTAAPVSGPAHGTLTLNAEGSFAYTPATNYAGPDSFTYKANDGQTGSNIATVSIAIQYSFAGFFQPVKNAPAVNAMKAGAAVPVKFSLGGDQGMEIFAAGSPTSQPVSCRLPASSSNPADKMSAASGTLSYNAMTGLYTYVWKTDKNWAGKCHVLIVQLDDGTQHLAYFRFK